jgi:ribonucleoside-diphosphate reductase alpha chain
MNIQDWLGADNTLGIDIWKNKYQYENETFDEWLDRVSGGNKAVKDLIC